MATVIYYQSNFTIDYLRLQLFFTTELCFDWDKYMWLDLGAQYRIDLDYFLIFLFITSQVLITASIEWSAFAATFLMTFAGSLALPAPSL